jgi:hypothetical protein
MQLIILLCYKDGIGTENNLLNWYRKKESLIQINCDIGFVV